MTLGNTQSTPPAATSTRPPPRAAVEEPDVLPPAYQGDDSELTAEEIEMLLDGLELQMGQRNKGAVQITSLALGDFCMHLGHIVGDRQPSGSLPIDTVKPAHAAFARIHCEKIEGLSGINELDIELQATYEGRVRFSCPCYPF